MRQHLNCWVVTNGTPGMEIQCVALAEALGFSPIIKRIRLKFLWRAFAPYLRIGLAHAFHGRGDNLDWPWPSVLIASGRKSVPASLFVREQSRASGGRGTFTIQIQDPKIDPSLFDLVIAPAHDRLTGANVITSAGSLHRVTPARLEADAAKLRPRIARFASPFVGVLVGGPNASSDFTVSEATLFARQLRKASQELGGSILVTPSRRTNPEILDAISKELADRPAWIWDGKGENPYYGILGLSDYLVVTADSVNMVTEAIASGKAVYVWPLTSRSKKFESFHRSLRERGVARIFAGRLEPCVTSSIGDMELVTAKVRRFLEEFFGEDNGGSLTSGGHIVASA